MNAVKNDRTGMWEVRVLTTFAGPSKEFAEKTAREHIAAYREVKSMLMSPIRTYDIAFIANYEHKKKEFIKWMEEYRKDLNRENATHGSIALGIAIIAAEEKL